MKKIKHVVLALVLVLAASMAAGCMGCRDEENTTSQEETTTERETTTEEETTRRDTPTEPDHTNGTEGGLINDISNGMDELGEDISNGIDGHSGATETRTDTGYTAHPEE